MTSSDSYDPLTWKPGDPPANQAAPVAARPVPRREKAAWLPLALSAAVLLGGAALASASRDDTPVTAPQSSG
jgi:hypothetical protein